MVDFRKPIDACIKEAQKQGYSEDELAAMLQEMRMHIAKRMLELGAHLSRPENDKLMGHYRP